MAEENDPMADAIKSGGGDSAASKKSAADQAAIDKRETAKVKALSDDEMAAVKKLTEQQDALNKLRPSPAVVHSTPAEIARPGDKTVTMIFPKDVFIWAEPTEKFPGRFKVQFRRGVCEVPESLSDHWYLAACGVKKHRTAA